MEMFLLEEGRAYVRGSLGCEAVAALSLWLSKLRACRGWLAGWLPEKLVGMRGQGRGRRLLPSPLTNKPMFVFYIPEANSDAKLLSMALDSFRGNRWLFGCPLQCVAEFQDLLENWSVQRLIKTEVAPPPRHLKPFLSPAIPRSLPHPCRWVHTGALFWSRLFLFSAIFHSFPVQHFCLSDACNWFIRMASLPPPSGLSLDWRPCCLWQEQHADRQENKLQVTSPQSVTVAVGFLVGQSRISPSEVVFLILHSHAS